MFYRYEKMLNRKAANEMPNFDWCALDGCISGQIIVPGEDCPGEPTSVVCSGCNGVYCFKHRTDWHVDLTCDEFDIILRGRSEAQDPFEYERLKAKMDKVDQAKLEEKQRRAEEDKRQMELSEATIQRDTMPCPKDGCGWQIERVGECSHMQCEFNAVSGSLLSSMLII